MNASSSGKQGANDLDWRSANVLVTGGTGSFGRKFTEIILGGYKPSKLIVFSRDELKQLEMRDFFPETDRSPIRYFIGDVRDKERLNRAFYGVDVVIHAAALKQVLACEYNPFEAVQTNIIGAKNVIDAAIDQGVKKVMAISTDKAVNPVNLYGATKLCAEKMFIQANSYSGARGTKFSVCRYGNVVGSRGSVVPLFLKQRHTGTITVTDARMTRFWLSLDKGARFVIRSTEQMHGGEVFVPKIPSMNIMELAQIAAPNCNVEYIGIRAGEKLHEVLISPDEAIRTLEFDDMFIIEPVYAWWASEHWEGQRRVPEASEYSSNYNDQRPTQEDLEALINQVEGYL